jgi:hypothetical protein
MTTPRFKPYPSGATLLMGLLAPIFLLVGLLLIPQPHAVAGVLLIGIGMLLWIGAVVAYYLHRTLLYLRWIHESSYARTGGTPP